MAWYHAFGIGRRRASAVAFAPTARTEAFSATAIPRPDRKLLSQNSGWQSEAWDFYATLGEYNYAVTWHSNMMSRVRLRAAELTPGRDEPTILDAGPAAELVARLAGGVPGQAQLLASLDVQLQVPGEGYLVGETVRGVERWQVRSTDELRVQNDRFQIVDGRLPKETWRDLAPDHLVNRVWRPDKRYYDLAASAARSALPTMRELELVNRHITAQYLSRLASAGAVVFPDEITFPVREEFEDSEDPFMAEWIEIAAQAIKNPGTASAVVPIPIRVPGEFVDKVKHLDFTLKIDDKIIEKRDSAIKRLAAQVNIPAEVLLGMGDVNHWGAWQLEEGALKANIAPDAELICQQLTAGYLQPRLIASGMPATDASRYVIWYDMSELALRPDRSTNAIQLYDRLELSGSALRRETGFDEDDLPTDDDLKTQALKVIIKTLPTGAASALEQLIGEEVDPIAPAGQAPPTEAEPEPDRQEQGPPQQPTEAVRDPEQATLERRARLHRQAGLTHALRIGLTGDWELLHPPGCSGHTYSCPVTHATWNLSSRARPGTAGLYECRIDAFGRPIVGPMVPGLDTTEFISTRSTARAAR